VLTGEGDESKCIVVIPQVRSPRGFLRIQRDDGKEKKTGIANHAITPSPINACQTLCMFFF
jgi:hypothetical protein